VPIPSDVFATGKTYAEYRQKILDAGPPARDKLELSESTLAQAKIDVDAFTRLPKPLNVLVLSEDWCSDCTDNVPILNRIAEESGKLNVRILSRDEHPEIADQYLKDGKYRSIPAIIFMDEQMNDIGAFHERPQSVTDLRAQKKAELYEAHPEFGSQDTPASELPDDIRAALSAALAESRASTRPFAIQEVVRELSDVAAKAAGA
jgi:glutaredoxin